jgi:hypothetical protein
MTMYYKLVGRDVVPGTIEDFIGSMNDPSRIIEKTEIGNVSISTVFLCLDHSFIGSTKGKPLVFETMVFGGKYNDEQIRYSTLDKAEAGHKEMIDKVKDSIEGEKE